MLLTCLSESSLARASFCGCCWPAEDFSVDSLLSSSESVCFFLRVDLDVGGCGIGGLVIGGGGGADEGGGSVDVEETDERLAFA